MVLIRPLALVFLMLGLAVPASASGATTRIILKRDPGLSTAEQRDIRKDAGVRLIDTLPLARTEVVATHAAKADNALRELNADDDVVYAELDRRRSVFANPPDAYRTWLWALDNTRQNIPEEKRGPNGETIFRTGTLDADADVYEAWGLETASGDPISGAGVTVAVVDSGVDDGHEDLAGQVVDQHDFINDTATATDMTGHGTAVTGIIAALRGNQGYVIGAAPQSAIMALRAIGSGGSGLDSDIAEAFTYAADHDVHIVNASLGGAGSSQTLDAAIHAAPDTLFIVSAGNDAKDNDTSQVWPCNSAEPNVLCVGSSDNQDARSTFSNYGDRTVDLFAPGDGILTTIPPSVEVIPGYPNQKYAFFYGTSMAAPYVSATAALVLQAKPDLTPEKLKAILLATADPKLAFVGYSVSAARLNANEAVKYAQGGPAPDGDGDGIANAADACPATAGVAASHGCPLDRDSDGKPDAIDNCDLNPNPAQADADRDGVGDVCDATPRGPDVDRDGKPALDDRCPTVYGTGPTGCPVATTTPASGDRDRDGHRDVADGCPNEPASTLDGCPLPAVTSLSARLRKHRASITVRTSRAATVKITVQRKRGKRWKRVTSTSLVTSSRNRVTLRTKRLRAGRYRVVVVLSSNAGRTSAQSTRFRVR